MMIIPNNISDKYSITITMLVDTNIILPVICLFLTERNARFEVL